VDFASIRFLTLVISTWLKAETLSILLLVVVVVVGVVVVAVALAVTVPILSTSVPVCIR